MANTEKLRGYKFDRLVDIQKKIFRHGSSEKDLLEIRELKFQIALIDLGAYDE